MAHPRGGFHGGGDGFGDRAIEPVRAHRPPSHANPAVESGREVENGGRQVDADDHGRFDVTGTYVRERPGPVRPNDSKGERARYRGRIEGKTMTLSVELAGSDVIIGPYTLERDRLPRIRKCG
jgi:hypothetical protein